MDNSVGIFKNKVDDNMILVPFGVDESGVSRGLKKYKRVNKSEGSMIVGASLKECFDIIINNEYTIEDMKNVDIKRITGDKSEKKFTEKHLYQIVFLVQHKGFEFEPKIRDEQYNCYSGNGWVSEELLLSASNEELGEAVFRTFELCK
ncbi:hypothetical protein ACQCVH_13710 [Bacillus infantis]|uniref:hypothetical protein n=1 Tax=Bacillus infantis TaxID=324767 RepID=UPI003CFAFAF8